MEEDPVLLGPENVFLKKEGEKSEPAVHAWHQSDLHLDLPDLHYYHAGTALLIYSCSPDSSIVFSNSVMPLSVFAIFRLIA